LVQYLHRRLHDGHCPDFLSRIHAKAHCSSYVNSSLRAFTLPAMDRINPTNPTDWIEPTLSFDNDSYFDLSIPLQESSTGSPLLGPRTAPLDTTNTDRVGPRERPAEYMATRQQTSNVDQYAYNDPSYVSRTPSRTSRPTSRPSSRPDRISVSPGAAYARYRGEDNLDIDVVQRVLGPPRRRRTPSLRRAPHVQWDTTRPLRTAPSFSTTGGSVAEDDTSLDRGERGLDGHADAAVRDGKTTSNTFS
jgi:hypothetical protein